MEKIKEIYQHNGTDWGNAIPIGVDAVNIDGLIDIFYPVGSYYETSDSTFNPNIAWDGIWELETEGQVHVSAGTNYAVSGALTNASDGGSKDAILIKHQHSINNSDVNAAFMGMCGSGSDAGLAELRVAAATSGSNYVPKSGASGTNYIRVVKTTEEGNSNSGTNKNMQPYINVYRWHRTA